MLARTRSSTPGILAGALCLAAWAQAGSPVPLSGGILGQVKNAAGVMQMGATVFLYNHFDRLVGQALTNEQGKFVFDGLRPDLYSIRVTLASFAPAFRRSIAVAAGSENLLRIDLAGMLSTVDLVPTSSLPGTLMTDDWKWVLRASQATRPVMRFLPVETSSSSSQSTASIFSDTTGMVRLSAGDGESFATDGQQDLGTAFAWATSINGSARIQFSGNLGYGSPGVPAGGFRARYSHPQEDGSGPEITLTIRQLYLPGPGGDAADASPALRTMSLGVLDRLELSDELHIEYGASLDSVSFDQRLNRISPFARVTYNLDEKSSLRLAFSSGTDPTDLVAEQGNELGSEPDSDLNQDLAALAQLPRISMMDARPQMQFTETFEAGYQRVEGSRTWSASMYHESVSNAAFIMSGPPGFVPFSDSLPDLASGSNIFDVGNYQDFGYAVGVKQSIGEHMDASLSAGRGGALTADSHPALPGDANALRGLIHETQRSWVTARISATLPRYGTRFSTDYGWMDYGVLMPAHFSLTQSSGPQDFGTPQANQETGWNIRVRQPLPRLGGLPGRLEANMDLCNLLAQGYLPLAAGGRHAVLTDAPRAVRGGLSFIF
jgi:hypothetical protein